ncbi:MAG: dimethylarginine dimethylaminohydrolase family protein [Pirellulaceae bacterium]
MSSEPHILMCTPEFFGIEYEINPWMKRERPADHALAARQWGQLKETLTSLGARISLLTPVPGLPDLVFTANAGLIHGARCILSRFRHVQRQGEEQHDADWFTSHGFEVVRLPEDMYFEGAGDALYCGDTLFAGYRRRSDARAMQQVGRLTASHVIPLELVDPYYYHLDTCFCPMAMDVAIYYPAAFDEYGQRVLRDRVPTLIEVTPEEARSFACNAVVVGKTVVTNVGCPQLQAALHRHGFATVETPLSEFVKAGGSAKCLTLRLDGEEAAGWKI